MKLANSEKKPLFFRIPISSQCQGTETEEGETGKEVQYTEKLREGKEGIVFDEQVFLLSLSLSVCLMGVMGLMGGKKKQRKKIGAAPPPSRQGRETRRSDWGKGGNYFCIKVHL